MIAGHFGLAAAVKAKAPTVPLWSLMLACQWLDVVFVPLFVAHVERIDMIPGAKPGGYGEGVIYADYTHSLVGALALSAAFGATLALRYGTRSGVVLALVAMSHWVLDLFMHRADMPILPGNAGDLPRLGFGLWRFPIASATIELAFVVVGGILYWRAAREVAGADTKLRGRAALCGMLALGSGVLTLFLNVIGQ